MIGYVDSSAVRKLDVYLGGVEAISDRAMTLMEELESLVVEDNRKAVLNGVQGDGSDSPVPPVTYRGQAVTTKVRARSGDRFGVTKGSYKGPKKRVGSMRLPASPSNGNLTTSQYKRLTGPALAPRGDESRIIANLFTRIDRSGDVWTVTKEWIGVVSTKGFAFLPSHFLGRGRLPKRDFRKLTSWGLREAQTRAGQWLRAELAKGG